MPPAGKEVLELDMQEAFFITFLPPTTVRYEALIQRACVRRSSGHTKQSDCYVPPPPLLPHPIAAPSQGKGTPQLVQAVAQAACAKPLDGQLPMFEVRTRL